MTGGIAQIRAATLDDVPAIRTILAAHDNDGPIGADGIDVVGPYVRQIITRHRALVSELEGEVVAFGGIVHAGVADHLSDLFVRPDLLGRGIGRPLLAALLGDAPRRTVFASDDPRALPSYVRAGMAPLWTCFYLRGTTERLPAPPGLRVMPAPPTRLAALELEWTDADRSDDHAFWAGLPDADTFVIEDDQGAVALAIARARQMTPIRALDRLLVRPGADPVPPIVAALLRGARAAPIQLTIPGPNPALPLLLEHGFLIVDRDQYLASSPDIVDPVRRLPNGGML